MPAGIRPKLAADLGVADQETDRLCDFGRLDQPAQPGEGKDVFSDVFFSEHPNHRRVSERKSAEPTGSADRLLDPASIATLNQPLNGPRPELFLSPTTHSQSNVSSGPDDLFFVSGTDQIVQRLGL
jgi:hypothetical protein